MESVLHLFIGYDYFWNYYQLIKMTPEKEIDWKEMYIKMRSLIITDGQGLIGDVRNEFKYSDSDDWRSFYRGWTQGRTDMIQKIIDLEKENNI